MDYSTYWICFLALFYVKVEGKQLLTGINENPLHDFKDSKIFQELQVNVIPRQKRNANDGCCKDCNCNKRVAAQPQPMVVNHYHNYYYCCPSVPHQLPQVAPQRPAVCSPQTKCVDCTCDNTGAISCSVPQPQQSSVPQSGGYPYQQSPQPSYVHQQNAPSTYQRGNQPGGYSYQPATPPDQRGTSRLNEAQSKDLTDIDKNTAFAFSVLDDPITKGFYDFVTTNFVKRDVPLAVAEIQCQSDPLSVFEDPICREFINLFSQTFERKSENTTSIPEQSQASPTQKPTSRP